MKNLLNVFFQKFKQNSLKSNKINSLYDQSGVLKNGLSEMLDIAAQYYEKLFRENVMNESMVESFLQHVQPMNITENMLFELCRDFTVDEMYDAIYSFKNFTSPGPDGLSIEFYKCVFSIIKDDLLAVYNSFKDQEFLPCKMKTGLITLIPKGDPLFQITNYRGITLNNVDLKILTKMLHNRLYPYLQDYLHSSQYANKGKKIWELNCTLRDLYMEMCEEGDLDSFMVRNVFQKAFDSVNMMYLYKVMEKMGIPAKFIAMVKAIDHDLTAKLVINGATSKKIKIKKGTRQGDPLSLDKFMIALDPLLKALDENQNIQKYVSKCNKEFLSLALADDLTLFTKSLSSLLHIKFQLGKFKEASGLEINLKKTKGFFFNRQNVHNIQHLPFDNWNKNMIILGIPYGTNNFLRQKWQDKFKELDKDISYFQSFKFLTYQAKAIISKSKLLPKVSYISSILPTPKEITEKIDDSLLRFVVPHKKTFLKVANFAAIRDMGGFGLAHITLHSDIMLIRNVLIYMKNREEGINLTNDQYFIEFNIGHQLSSLWNLPINNDTCHALEPNNVYLYVLNFLKKLKSLGIGKDVLLKAKVKNIYQLVLEKMNLCNFTVRWRALHSKIFPNYLISFNYKVHFNLLPVKAKFQNFALDNESRCGFCNVGFETIIHIFGKCDKLGILWDFLDEVMALMNINYKFTTKRKLQYEFEIMNIRFTSSRGGGELKLIMYLSTIVNYHLWKMRNRCVHENENFNYEKVVNKLIRSVGSRKNLQQRFTLGQDVLKIPRIDELLTSLITLKNITFHFDNG